jgi:hypothetical protein
MVIRHSIINFYHIIKAEARGFLYCLCCITLPSRPKRGTARGRSPCRSSRGRVCPNGWVGMRAGVGIKVWKYR